MQDLTPAQHQFLEALAKNELGALYYLSGGTALGAFHLHHRRSDDLDFFSRESIDFTAVLRFVESVADGPVIPRRVHDRLGLIVPMSGETLRVEFVKYDHPAIEPPTPRVGALCVDGLRDILANKLSAIIERAEPKDYADIYFLVARAGLSLEQGIADTKTKFGWPSLEILLQGAFLRLDRMTAWPDLEPKVTLEEARATFRAWAKALIRVEE